MKKLTIIYGLITLVILASCSGVKREPGSIYMPDMAYSRAYETYAGRDTSVFTTDKNSWESNGTTKIFYNNQPVAGTVSRGEKEVFHIEKDKAGDTTNYYAARLIQNPLPALTGDEATEAERLYLINCGICHGAKLDGNGPLYKDGAGPYPAKPANLSGSDPKYVAMTDGTMFYSITYGKNLMGSYAGQVTPHQRWMIIHYIRAQQAGKTNAAAAPAAAKDSVAKK